MRNFCTYFDHNYLPRAMVMLESLHEHCPDAHVHVLCLSPECHGALRAIAYPFVTAYPLSDLEAADPELAATRSTRTLVAYYFTLTPCWPWHLLRRAGLGEVTYLDADMMFFSSPEPLFAEAGEAAVIVTPHKFSPRLRYLDRFGLFNVSWLTFRNVPEGMACLGWYREACLEWCHDRVEGDRFADQKYLDAFPEKFAGVRIMRHPGGGVAPWNLEGTAFGMGEAGGQGELLIDGQPLIFYHAHGLKHLWGPLYSSGLLEYGTGMDTPEKRRLLARYLGSYANALKRAAALVSGSGFSSIRYAAFPSRSPFRLCGRIFREYRAKTLIFSV